MIDFLLHATLSNLIVCLVLAILAWVFQRSDRSVLIANLLWTLVLIKMVTPPLFSLPVIEVASYDAPSDVVAALTNDNVNDEELQLESSSQLGDAFAQNVPQETGPLDRRSLASWLLIGWAMSSAGLLTIVLVRVYKFDRLLRQNSCASPARLSELIQELSSKMGMKPPTIKVISAELSPFVWGIGTRPQVIISSSATGLPDSELRLVLAHELAHIARHDHWIRWVECLATTVAWWNPILWWARRQLRKTEEIACDRLVLSKLKAHPGDYAGVLLNMAEFFSTSTVHPPAVASGINSGGILEQRLNNIMSTKIVFDPIWLRPTIAILAFCIAPLGFVHSQDIDALEKRLGGAIEAGELTIDEAKIMLDALRNSEGKTQTQKQPSTVRQREDLQRERAFKEAVVADLNKNWVEELRRNAERQFESVAQARDPKEKDRKTQERLRQDLELLEGSNSAARLAAEAAEVSKARAEEQLAQITLERLQAEKARSNRATQTQTLNKRLKLELESLNAALKEGEISKKNAAKKQAELRKMLLLNDKEQQSVEKRERELLEQTYKSAFEKLQENVEQGDLSKKDAEKALHKLRSEAASKSFMALQQDRVNLHSVDRFNELEAAAQELVREKEEKTKRTSEMLQEISPADQNLEDRSLQYRLILQKIERAVVQGKLSPVDAEKQILDLQRILGQSAQEKEPKQKESDVNKRQ